VTIHAKTLMLCCLFAVAARAPTSLNIDTGAHCPASSANQIVVALPSPQAIAPVMCLILDPAGFTIDQSTNPPTVRVIGAAGPAGAVGGTGTAGATGATGPAGTSAPVINFVDDDTACASWPGASVYALTHEPNPASSVTVSQNGLKLKQGNDYTVSGSMVTFLANPPHATDLLTCAYRYRNDS